MDSTAAHADSLNSASVQLSSPLPLNTRTSSQNALNTTFLDVRPSPPQTPKARRKRAGQKDKEPTRPRGRREEQLKRQNSEGWSNQRHSHGLSWSSTTEDGVVDNLLLSLDSLSTQNVPGMETVPNDEFGKKNYRLPQLPQVSQHPKQRARGHTYSSSVSSGYDNYVDPPGSRYSTSTKGRHSRSGSNLAAHNTVSGRVHHGRMMNSVARSSSETHRVNGIHGHKESSDLDSVEQGYSSVLKTDRPYSSARRSVSMDHIYSQRVPAKSIRTRERPIPLVHTKTESQLDAAPEPMIPAGPRKMQNPTATGPVFVNAVPTKAVRKINTQSDLRSANKPLPIPKDILDQASDFVHANSMRGMPSIPLPHQHSVPAPSPGLQYLTRKDALSPYRERPGFFRRVFGGGNSRSASSLSDRSERQGSAHGYLDKAAPPFHSKSRASSSIDNGFQSVRQTSNEHPSPITYVPPSLNKKPSSFFRRRKKSAADSVQSPPLPVSRGLNMNLKSAEPSLSVRSLRKVMDPHLSNEGTPAHNTPNGRTDDSRPTTQETITEDSDDLEVFHTGYTPPRDASLGRRNPISRELSPKAKDSNDYGNGPKIKIKIKKRPLEIETAPARAQRYGESSFLEDATTESSTATLGEHFVSSPEPLKVSLMSEDLPALDNKKVKRPASRASTGDRIIASLGNSPIEASEEARSFSAGTNISLDPNDEGWVMRHLSMKMQTRPESKKSERLFLKPTEAEEGRQDSVDTLSPMGDTRITSRTVSLQSPILHASTALQSPVTPSTLYHSATSLPLPSVQVEGNEIRKSSELTDTKVSTAMLSDEAEYRERARRIFEGDDGDVANSEAAAWLGEKNILSARTLEAYMQLFDFAGMNILAALRALCGKLLLKGETQQFDRIITTLSARWCECNSSHGFKAQDVVHTIFYSLILLNTDLHLADIGEKMSKTAYVKNTLPTITRVVEDAAPNAFDDTVKPSPQTSRPSLPWMDSNGLGSASSTFSPNDTSHERTSLDVSRPQPTKRLSSRPGMMRTDSDGWTPDPASNTASNALVNNTWYGPRKGWESEIETVLKSFFVSIRMEPLPMVGVPALDFHPADRNLLVANFTGLKRSGSVISKSPSDNMSYKSKPGFRAMTMGWQSRYNRSRPTLYPASTVASSRTSFDDGSSVWSPAQSSNWSKNSFAKTLTSASVGSLGYHLSPAVSDYKHSIGFANALSQAIIREESAGGAADNDSLSMPGSLLEDEALALEGAPWAKEGLVKHKHRLETPDRKAKERNWNDVFAVISKGKLTLFNFNTSSRTQTIGRKSHGRQTGRAASIAAPTVGGGDWMENAEQLDVFTLRHTIASTLPSPGYSKARPYVWALSLPSGAVHLFQVGTPQIAEEFMSTANYWSARLSKEPLSGSVSNIEYGWSDQVINTALRERSESVTGSPPSVQNGPQGNVHSSSGHGNLPRPSYQSSTRGSFDTGFGSTKAKLPGDKAQIADWHQPSQSMMASQLMEVNQLRAFRVYVSGVEAELAKHNELKHAIELAYSPRHQNYSKAIMNWQRKSEYLLRETVKFRTYIDSLSAAQKSKEAFDIKRTERDMGKGGVSPVDSGRMREDRDSTLRVAQPAS